MGSAKLARDAFAQAERGGGWVDCEFANPQSGAVDLKTSSVEAISAELVMGCGIYKQRGAASALAGGSALKGIRNEQRERIANARPLAA